MNELNTTTMQLNPYLSFDGQCEAAFKFYERCLGAKIECMMTYESRPAEYPVPADWRKKIFFPLHRAVRKNRVAQALLSRVSPVLSYDHALPLPDELQRQWALLDTHDSLTDWHKHFRTKRQFRRVLESLGAVEIYCEYGGNGVDVRCRRPRC